MKKVCISGYFGFDNIGDEAVLQAMIRSIRAKVEDVEIIVLSDNPEKTAADYQVIAYDRWRWFELRRAIKSADLLISGGGSLFQDVTGRKSLIYYLHIIKMALRRKKPVIVYSQGIGPIKSPWGQKRTVKVLRKVKKVTVRDEDSAKTLQAWGFRRGRVKITADPVLNIGDLDRDEVQLELSALSAEDRERIRQLPAAETVETTEAAEAVEAVETTETTETAAAAAASQIPVNEQAAPVPPVTDLEATIVLDDLRRLLTAKRAAAEAAPADGEAAPKEGETSEEAVAKEDAAQGENREKAAETAETSEVEETAETAETAAAEKEAAENPEEAPAESADAENGDAADAIEETAAETEAPAAESAAEETNETGESDETDKAEQDAETPTEAGEDGAASGETEVAEVSEAETSAPADGRVPLAALKQEGEKWAAFSIRQWDGLPVEDIAALADLMIDAGYRILFLPFQYPDDNRMEKDVIAKINGPVLEVDRNLTPAEMLYCFDQVDFLFGMRLHALIIGAALGIPFASLSYDPKIDGFVKSVGLEVTGSLESYDRETFLERFKGDLARADEIRATLAENLPDLREKAEEATDYVVELLSRGR